MKHLRQKLMAGSFFAIVVLGTVIMALLFIFPTKDTREETMAAFGAMEGAFNGVLYDDRELASGAAVRLEDDDLRLMDKRNRRSGAQFTEEEVRRLKVLRTRFPENSLIPRTRSPEEERSLAAEVAQLDTIKKQFSRKAGARKDIDLYFDRQIRTLEDWIQLLEFVVHDENWSPKVKDKYERMLANAPRLRARIEKQRAQILELNGHL